MSTGYHGSLLRVGYWGSGMLQFPIMLIYLMKLKNLHQINLILPYNNLHVLKRVKGLFNGYIV